MNLYEIDQEILNLVDEETGEITDIDKLNNLCIEKNKKLENIACWIKNLVSDVKELEEEIKVLNTRKTVAKNKADRLKRYLSNVLAGAKFETAKCSVSYRKSESVEIEEGFTDWAEQHYPDIVTYSEPKIDKRTVKDMIKSGEPMEFAHIVEKTNIQIK